MCVARAQERRNYIPQGWSKFYEFSYADLRSGADVMTLGAWALHAASPGRMPLVLSHVVSFLCLLDLRKHHSLRLCHS